MAEMETPLQRSHPGKVMSWNQAPRAWRTRCVPLEREACLLAILWGFYVCDVKRQGLKFFGRLRQWIGMGTVCQWPHMLVTGMAHRGSACSAAFEGLVCVPLPQGACPGPAACSEMTLA